ncbi:MAG: hypothetical protein LBT40_06025 [Deltaproteobacteria bacterium]|jgi:hypothetical protein|nr:hypothetical protein [Deltaproteobacteria bacterium]
MTSKSSMPDFPVRKHGAKSGLILAFALGVLVLMALMGIVILSNTRTEMNITANSRLGRESFNSADAMARVATFLTLAMLNQVGHNIDDVITSSTASLSPPPRYPLYVCLKSKFNYEDITHEATNYDYVKRYTETGAGSLAADPHITFELGPCGSGARVIATAVVNLDTTDIISSGMSLSTGDPNDSSGGQKTQVGIVISVNAKTYEAASRGADDPNSIITVMYRSYM